MSKVFFISDTHFGHRDIHTKFRTGFSSVLEHDETITDNILTTCSKRDTLYILGDVVIRKESLSYLERICDSIRFVRIILGNHDNELTRKYNPTVVDLLGCGVTSINGVSSYKEAWLTHVPIHESEFRKKLFNIHGHNHNEEIIKDSRYINVACEHVNYMPVGYAELIEKAH